MIHGAGNSSGDWIGCNYTISTDGRILFSKNYVPLAKPGWFCTGSYGFPPSGLAKLRFS
jgi:hypothetical protein